MNSKSRKQVAEEAIGLGALAQLSRNRKINGAGEVFIFVGLITLIGELIKFPIKWLIVKPFIFCIKVMWKVFKYTFIYGSALFLTLSQFAYKGIKELNTKYKEKKQL